MNKAVICWNCSEKDLWMPSKKYTSGTLYTESGGRTYLDRRDQYLVKSLMRLHLFSIEEYFPTSDFIPAEHCACPTDVWGYVTRKHGGKYYPELRKILCGEFGQGFPMRKAGV